MLPRVAGSFVLFVAVIAIGEQKAHSVAGNVAWSKGYAKAVNTVRNGKGMITVPGKIKVLGTQAPDPAADPVWTPSNPSTLILNNAGGIAFQGSIDMVNADLGLKDPATGAIGEYTKEGLSPGTYSVFLKVVYARFNNRGIESENITSPLSTVTIN
jgi:hypothetical protein